MGNISNYTKLEKDDLIKKEIKKLKKTFKNLEKDQINASISLIESAAFMTVTLNDLQETINRNGVVSEYQNGDNQWGTKKSPEVEIYNSMIKNHIAVIKQLTDLLKSSGKKGDDDDDFDQFVQNK